MLIKHHLDPICKPQVWLGLLLISGYNRVHLSRVGTSLPPSDGISERRVDVAAPGGSRREGQGPGVPDVVQPRYDSGLLPTRVCEERDGPG